MDAGLRVFVDPGRNDKPAPMAAIHRAIANRRLDQTPGATY
jgi:hypothetical protein